MNPRHSKNQKWTAFPTELTQQIRQVFEQTFATQLKSTSGAATQVNVFGKIYTKELCLRVGLHKKGELRHQNFEVSVDHNGDHENVVSKIHVCVDAIAGLVQEYFENDEDHELPYTWTEHAFQTLNDQGKAITQTIYVQFSRENPDLEAEANRLLGESSDDSAMVHGDDEDPDVDVEVFEASTDATNDQDHENADDDESFENQPSSPSMFGGKKKRKEDMH